MRYNIVLTNEGTSTIVLTDDNLNTRTITDDHPNFIRIMDGLRNGEDVSGWLNPDAGSVLTKLSDRVSVDGSGTIHFDGDPVYNGLADTIQRYRREGREPHNLIRFMERLSENPSRRSREQLFTWTQAKELVIDADGFIIAYKGVTADMLSVSRGSALVDGVPHEGQIPNEIGKVISMPRSEVQDDPNQGCSYGLHVGNWAYASGFGQVLLEVQVDPADVVSVPSDCAYQKMRCCRYRVITEHVLEDDDLSDYEPEATWDDDEVMDAWTDDAEDAFFDYVPTTFMDRLRDKLRRR